MEHMLGDWISKLFLNRLVLTMCQTKCTMSVSRYSTDPSRKIQMVCGKLDPVMLSERLLVV